MADEPIASAHVEILPDADAAKFEAAINKIIAGVGDRLDKAFDFDRITRSAAKAAEKSKDLGKAGKSAGKSVKEGGEEGEHGLKKLEEQTKKNISALQKFKQGAEGTESSFKRIATRITEAFSIYEVAKFVKESIDVSEAYDKTGRVVEQAFRSTGRVAGVTTKQFQDLTDKISETTGITETSVNAATQQLIAFTNIRNVAGQGNDIFTRSAKAIQDISVRTGLGSVSVARTLGKALEDPAKSALVLRRASVLLTEQQNKQIAVFEKSGNTLEAQKVILDAVSQKFGGAAEAAADPLSKLSTAVDHIKRTLGESLKIPTLDDFANAVIAHLPDIERFTKAIGTGLHGVIVAITPSFNVLADAIERVVTAVSKSDGLQQFAKYALLAAVAFKVLREAMKAFLEIEVAVEFITLILEGEFAAAFAVVTSPLTIIIAVIAAVAAGLLYLYNNVKPVHEAVDNFANAIKTNVIPVLEEWWKYFKQKILPVIEEVIKFGLRILVAEFKIVVAYVKDILIPAYVGLWHFFEKNILPTLKKVGTFVKDNLVGQFKDAVNIIKTVVLPGFQKFGDFILGLFSTLLGAASSAAHALGFNGLGNNLDAAKKAVNKFKDDVNKAIGEITEDKTVTISFAAGGNLAAAAAGRPGVSHQDEFRTALFNEFYDQAFRDYATRLHQGTITTAQITHIADVNFRKYYAKINGDVKDPTAKPPPPTGGGGGTPHTPKKPKQNANLTELVRDIAFALNDGLKKGSEAASKTVSALEAKIRAALKGTLQEALTAKTVSYIEKQRTALVSLAGAYDRTAKITDGLRKKVDTLRKATEDFKHTVFEALQQTSNLDAFLSNKDSSSSNFDRSPLAQASFNGIAVGATTTVNSASAQAQQYASFLANQAAQLIAYRANLSKLISRIGDTAFVQDLASKGLASADLVASLAAAPDSTLKQIDALQSQILALQKDIATKAAVAQQAALDKAVISLQNAEKTQKDILTKIGNLSHEIVNGLAHLFGVKVPKNADGGIFDRPTFGQFGEAGREVIIPVTRPQRAMDLMNRSGLTSMVTRNSATNATRQTVNHNNFHLVPLGDPAVHADQVATRLGAMAFR